MGATRLEGGCEVIEKQEISELARELSLDLHVVEKDSLSVTRLSYS